MNVLVPLLLTGYDASHMWYSEIKDYNFKGGDQLKCGKLVGLFEIQFSANVKIA